MKTLRKTLQTLLGLLLFISTIHVDAASQFGMRRFTGALVPTSLQAVPTLFNTLRFNSNASRTRSIDEPYSGTYADATVDTAFKEMMWKQDNDPVALSFIRAFLPNLHIQSVEKLKTAPIAIPALKARGRKQTFMDFHVTSQDGHHYLIEMQSQRHVRFDERSLFYACSVYSRQLEDKHFNDSSWFRYLKPVIAIQVVDYDTNRTRGITVEQQQDDNKPESRKIDPDDEDFVKRVKESPLPAGAGEKHFMMTDCYSGQKLDHLQMLQIELPRFNISKLPDFGKTDTEKNWWIRILRHSEEYKENEINSIQGVPPFVKEALDRLNFKKWNPDIFQEYKDSVVDRGQYSTVMQIEREEGKIEGKAEGVLATAKRMKDGGLPTDKIIAFTGLSLDEVSRL